MNKTTLEAPLMAQGLPVYEYMEWSIFKLFFLIIVANLLFLGSQSPNPDEPDTRTRAGQPCRDDNTTCSNCNSGAVESFFGWSHTSTVIRNIKSRTDQCILVVISSFVLAIQLIEGCWILEMVARCTSQAIVAAVNAPAPVRSLILGGIFYLIKAFGILALWVFFLSIGAVVLFLQFDYIKTVLRLKVEQRDERCQCAGRAATGSASRNGRRQLDMELGTVESGEMSSDRV